MTSNRELIDTLLKVHNCINTFTAGCNKECYKCKNRTIKQERVEAFENAISALKKRQNDTFVWCKDCIYIKGASGYYECHKKHIRTDKFNGCDVGERKHWE